jgi:LmbE family N-acetylglucosaminyl deacetylase
MVFVSPHLDDVALSVGGSVHRLARAGHPVTIITVFAGVPPSGPFSAFARGLHAAWGLGPTPTEGRRAEDRQAAAELGGPGLTVVHLEYLDAIYRLDAQGDPRYPDWDAVSSGRLHALDADLIIAIAGALRRYLDHLNPSDAAAPAGAGTGCARVLGPLGAGAHVDHLVVRRAIAHAVAQGAVAQGAVGIDPTTAVHRDDGSAPPSWPVSWYEDLPYVALGGPLTPAAVAGLRPLIDRLDDSDLAAKMRAVARYESQIATVFSAETPRLLERYARSVGRGHPAERLWIAHTSRDF